MAPHSVSSAPFRWTSGSKHPAPRQPASSQPQNQVALKPQNFSTGVPASGANHYQRSGGAGAQTGLIGSGSGGGTGLGSARYGGQEGGGGLAHGQTASGRGYNSTPASAAISSFHDKVPSSRLSAPLTGLGLHNSSHQAEPQAPAPGQGLHNSTLRSGTPASAYASGLHTISEPRAPACQGVDSPGHASLLQTSAGLSTHAQVHGVGSHSGPALPSSTEGRWAAAQHTTPHQTGPALPSSAAGRWAKSTAQQPQSSIPSMHPTQVQWPSNPPSKPSPSSEPTASGSSSWHEPSFTKPVDALKPRDMNRDLNAHNTQDLVDLLSSPEPAAAAPPNPGRRMGGNSSGREGSLHPLSGRNPPGDAQPATLCAGALVESSHAGAAGLAPSGLGGLAPGGLGGLAPGGLGGLAPAGLGDLGPEQRSWDELKAGIVEVTDPQDVRAVLCGTSPAGLKSVCCTAVPDERMRGEGGPALVACDAVTEGLQVHVKNARFWLYPIHPSVREYQYRMVQSALFSNTLVCLPTGLGKTLIAAVLMYNYYRWFPSGKIVFLAPTRPLVSQQMQACQQIMGLPKADIMEMKAVAGPAGKRQAQWDQHSIFFCCPQILENDLKNGIFPEEKLVLVVVDECHRAIGNAPAANALNFLKRNKALKYRILGLSATPGSSFEAIQFRCEDDADVAPYCHSRNVEVHEVDAGNGLSVLQGKLNLVMSGLVKKFNEFRVSIRGDVENLTRSDIQAAEESWMVTGNVKNSGLQIHTLFKQAIFLVTVNELLASQTASASATATASTSTSTSMPFFTLIALTLNELEDQANCPSAKIRKLEQLLLTHFRGSSPPSSSFKPSHPATNRSASPQLPPHKGATAAGSTTSQLDTPLNQRKKEMKYKTPTNPPGGEGRADSPEPGAPAQAKAAVNRVIIFTTRRATVHEIRDCLARHKGIISPKIFIGQGSGQGAGKGAVGKGKGKAAGPGGGMNQKEQKEVLQARLRHADRHFEMSRAPSWRMIPSHIHPQPLLIDFKASTSKKAVAIGEMAKKGASGSGEKAQKGASGSGEKAQKGASGSGEKAKTGASGVGSKPKPANRWGSKAGNAVDEDEMAKEVPKEVGNVVDEDEMVKEVPKKAQKQVKNPPPVPNQPEWMPSDILHGDELDLTDEEDDCILGSTAGRFGAASTCNAQTSRQAMAMEAPDTALIRLILSMAFKRIVQRAINTARASKRQRSLAYEVTQSGTENLHRPSDMLLGTDLRGKGLMAIDLMGKDGGTGSATWKQPDPADPLSGRGKARCLGSSGNQPDSPDPLVDDHGAKGVDYLLQQAASVSKERVEQQVRMRSHPLAAMARLLVLPSEKETTPRDEPKSKGGAVGGGSSELGGGRNSGGFQLNPVRKAELPKPTAARQLGAGSARPGVVGPAGDKAKPPKRGRPAGQKNGAAGGKAAKKSVKGAPVAVSLQRGKSVLAAGNIQLKGSDGPVFLDNTNPASHGVPSSKTTGTLTPRVAMDVGMSLNRQTPSTSKTTGTLTPPAAMDVGMSLNRQTPSTSMTTSTLTPSMSMRMLITSLTTGTPTPSMARSLDMSQNMQGLTTSMSMIITPLTTGTLTPSMAATLEMS
eukprot:gene8631-34076_t